MAKITAQYEGQLRTRAIHERSQSELITDAPVDNKGKGEAFSPTDLTATSLLTCMLTIMGIAADEKHISMNGVEAEVEKVMVSNPRRIAELNVQIRIREEGQSEKEKRTLFLAAEQCPVALSLHPDIKQQLSITYY